MQLYLLLDTSGSMDGAKISALNDSMENIIVDLQEKANHGNDINLSVLSFSKNIKWMYDKPINILDFTWNPLTASGMTSLGKACCELANVISTHAEIQGEKIIIILLSDGCPTDDYEEGIFQLHKLPAFNMAEKFAIAFGDNADVKSLSMFVDENERIFIENRADGLLDVLNSIIGKITPDIDNFSSIGDVDDDDWS